MRDKPLLFVDIDGVISLWGFASNARPAGAFHNVNGVVHFRSSDAGIHLLALALPRWLPFLSFARNPGRANGRWKLAASDEYA